MRRWLLLLFANFLGILILLYFLDYFGFVSTYSDVKDRIFLEVEIDPLPTEEEALLELQLIEAEEREKLRAFLEERERSLVEKEEEVKADQARLQEERQSLASERESLIKKEEELTLRQSEKNAYNVKVADLANRFFNMPPQAAMERILALEDDLLILDVLKGMDQVAVQRGQQSIVPFLISLMPPDQAARILKKSTVSL